METEFVELSRCNCMKMRFLRKSSSKAKAKEEPPAQPIASISNDSPPPTTDYEEMPDNNDKQLIDTSFYKNKTEEIVQSRDEEEANTNSISNNSPTTTDYKEMPDDDQLSDNTFYNNKETERNVESRDEEANTGKRNNENNKPNLQPTKIHLNEHDSNHSLIEQESKEIVSSRKRIVNLMTFSEEGSGFLGGLGFVGGMCMVFSSTRDFQDCLEDEDTATTAAFAMLSLYTWLFGMFIIVLEGRAVLIEISSFHRMISNYIKVLRFLWGRGIFYMFVGSIQAFGLTAPFGKYVGCFMLSLGLFSFLLGLIARIHAERLRERTPTAMDFMQLKFDFYDTDRDGYIDKDQFRDFVISLDLSELQYIDFDTAFRSIDEDNDGKITCKELATWWSLVDYRNYKNILDSRLHPSLRVF